MSVDSAAAAAAPISCSDIGAEGGTLDAFEVNFKHLEYVDGKCRSYQDQD